MSIVMSKEMCGILQSRTFFIRLYFRHFQIIIMTLAELDHIGTLKKIDVFDYDTCENENLLEAMDRYGKKMY